MKTVFLDTNVILDFVTQRDGYENACDIFQLGEDKVVSLCVSFLTMANTAYVARRGRTKDELYGLMEGLTEMFEVLQMNQEQLRSSLAIIAADFEDVLQYICALYHNCDVIVTNNTKHFKFSKIQVLTPKEVLKYM